MRHATLLATGLALLAIPALGDGLDKKLVPADSRWVAHVDLDGLQKTELFAEFRKRVGAEFEEGLDEFRGEVGVDPLKVFHSITVVSPTTKEETAAILVRGGPGVDRILERLQKEDAYRTVTHEGLTLHTWREGHDGVEAFRLGADEADDDVPYAYIHRSADSDERIIVLSNRASLVVSTVRVLTGDAPSLARARGSKLKADPLPGSVLYVEVSESLAGMGNFEPVSQVANMMRSLKLQVGESRGRFFVNALLETGSVEEASKISQIVTGAKALVSLAAGSELPLFAQDLLEALQVTASGSHVTIDLAYDSRRLIEELDELDER